MIHSTQEEVRIMVYIISFGVFCLSSYDTLLYLIKNIKKIPNLIIQSIFSLIMIYFTYEFSYKLAYGYIPIHYILFLIIGFIIYKLIRKEYLEGLNLLTTIFLKIKPKIIKIMVFLLYPKEFIAGIKVPFIYMKDTLENFFKVIIKEKQEKE